MKNILCKLGFHKPDKYHYETAIIQKGRHKYRRNYAMCRRCGKRLHAVSIKAGGKKI